MWNYSRLRKVLIKEITIFECEGWLLLVRVSTLYILNFSTSTIGLWDRREKDSKKMVDVYIRSRREERDEKGDSWTWTKNFYYDGHTRRSRVVTINNNGVNMTLNTSDCFIPHFPLVRTKKIVGDKQWLTRHWPTYSFPTTFRPGMYPESWTKGRHSCRDGCMGYQWYLLSTLMFPLGWGDGRC